MMVAAEVVGGCVMSDAAVLRTEAEALDLIRRTLREPIKPRSLYLFGSRSDGTSRPDSDYDILVVVDGPSRIQDRVALSTLWRGRLAKLGLDADILVKTPAEIAEYRDKLGSIINTALQTGIPL
jgi:predicted nucleotidyltransferase